MDLTVFEQEMIRKIDELQAKITECESTLINLEKNEEIKKPFVSLFKERVWGTNNMIALRLCSLDHLFIPKKTNKLDHLLMFSPKKTID